MPAYIVRIAGTNILAGFYGAERWQLAILIDEERTRATSSVPSYPKATASSSARPGPRQAPHRRPRSSEALGAADYIYLTEDLSTISRVNVS